MVWKTLVLLPVLCGIATQSPGWGSPVVDHRYAPQNVRTLIGVKDGNRNPVVLEDGSLLIGEWSLEAELLAINGNESIPRIQWQQNLLDGYLPVVQTQAKTEGLQIRKTAFTVPLSDSPCDVVQVEILNGESQEQKVDWLVRFGAASVRLEPEGLVLEATPGTAAYLRRESAYRVSGIELRARPHAIGYVGHHIVESPWAETPGGVVAAFKDAAVGPNGTPVHFRFPGQPDTKYRVILGLCEGRWDEAGRRLLDLHVEGDTALTVDPVEISGRNKPTTLQFLAYDENRDGWIDIVSVANERSPDQKAILNAIWVLDPDADLDNVGTNLLTGSVEASLLFESACGSRSVHAAGGTDGIVHTSIPPYGWASFSILSPWNNSESARAPRSGPAVLLDETRSWWWPFLDESVDISVPDKVVVDFYRSCIAQLFLSGDGNSTERTFNADSACSIRLNIHEETSRSAALSMAGYSWAARQYLDRLIASYRQKEWAHPRFRWCGAGEIIWALWLEHKLNGFGGYLVERYPVVAEMSNRLIECRDLESKVPANRGAPHEGLLPIPSDTGEQSLEYYFGENSWGVIGLRLASEMAEEIGERYDARRWRLEHRRYKRDLTEAIQKSYQKREGYLPATISGDTGHYTWENLYSLYPVSECADVEELKATVRWLEGKFRNDLPVALGLQGESTYLSVAPLVAGSFLTLRERDKVPRTFYAFMNHASRTKTWGRLISPEKRIGAGDVPDIRAVAGYVLLLRNMIIWENQDQLHLAPATERSWLYPGCTISVVDAPSLFGLITFNLQRISPETLLGTLTIPDQDKHIDVHIHLRLPDGGEVAEAILNGHRVPLRDGQIMFPSSGGIYDIHVDIVTSQSEHR